MTNIIVGDSIKSIGIYTFDETAWLNNQPNGLIYIGNWFYKYKYIGELKPGFQANLRADTIGIAGGAFEPVKIVLTEVSLPNGLKYIGKYAFQGCCFLENITLPETILSIGEGAFENSVIKEAILPKNLKYLGGYVFMNCNYLLNVTIPKGVTKINPRSFAFCAQLKEVNIYSRLESIETGVFLLCQQLESIIFYSNTVPKITPTTFIFQEDIAPENFKIYVPEINVEKFKSAGGWSVFIQNIFPWSV
ncbi:MAG: leucine-rich repeat domain-containing protein [Clostridia bacterium]|nr:leucine-rich repeat domain-containing protein [Clostridia bacterium]MDD4686269.1 leucine-rich repeat domain-containing protein [Clostridia bacterium]